MVQRLIPGYASLARLGVALLAASPRASAEGAAVLVAGCGTGAELLEARNQRPDWRLTAIDPSAEMLEIARRRLGGGGRDHLAPEHRGGAGGGRDAAGFDGALSVLVLQSLPDDGGKLAFLSALSRTLRPGGQLVLVDLMQPERSPLLGQVESACLASNGPAASTAPPRSAPSSPGAPTRSAWHGSRPW